MINSSDVFVIKGFTVFSYKFLFQSFLVLTALKFFLNQLDFFMKFISGSTGPDLVRGSVIDQGTISANELSIEPIDYTGCPMKHDNLGML